MPAIQNYWQIAGNPKVFKAATNELVSTSDTGFTTWLAAGNRVTPIGSEVELWGVMRTYLPEQYPEWLFNGTTFIQPAANNYTPMQLKSYAAQKRWEVEVGGIDFTPRAGASQGVSMLVDTSRESQAAVDAAALTAERNPAFVVQWKTKDGVFREIEAATMILMGGSVAIHVQRCFDGEQNCQSYTTLSQIDDEFVPIGLLTYPDASQP